MRSFRAFRRAGRGTVALFLLALSCVAAAAPAPAKAAQTYEGTLQVQVEDYSDRRSLTRYYLIQGARRLELRDPRGALNLPSGSKVRVRGTRTGDLLALDSSGSSNVMLTSAAEPTQALSASGVQNVAVMMVNFTDDASQPVSAAALQTEIFGVVSDFLRENSGERIWLTGSIHGWYTLPMSKATCDTTQLANLADQAAAAAGVNLSAYSRKFYVFPRNACTFDGLGVSGGTSTRAWFNGKFDRDVIAHEFGHNLGLAHSHGLNCDTSPLGATCVAQDYGDVADTMGNGPGHFNAFQKERLGWIDDLVTVTASGRYKLAPYALGTGARALKVSRGTDAWYYLEYRQPQGFDAPLATVGNMTAGVLLRKASTGPVDSANSSFLLDTTPNSYLTAGDLRDGALQPGRSFTDAATGVSIAVVSADASGAVVDISLAGGGTACTVQPPSLTLSAPPATAPGATSSISVTVVNRDSSACAATSFDLARLVPVGWTGQLSSSTLQLSAGATGSGTLSLTSPVGVAAGDYPFSVSVSCSRGAACAASATGTQSVASPTLTQTVATSKAVYKSGELVGLGAQLLDRGIAVAGATVSFTITGPAGKPIVVSAVTGATGTASASYRLNKKRDGPGSYSVRAQASWAGQSVTASTAFQVQ